MPLSQTILARTLTARQLTYIVQNYARWITLGMLQCPKYVRLGVAQLGQGLFRIPERKSRTPKNHPPKTGPSRGTNTLLSCAGALRVSAHLRPWAVRRRSASRSRVPDQLRRSIPWLPKRAYPALPERRLSAYSNRGLQKDLPTAEMLTGGTMSLRPFFVV